ncbi:dihydroxyacetone kinase subunit DhaK [Cellulomonas bogoriensis]|uniref:Dihydroxyacetone kinase n=1 Tax=Cellulomonas bogoriensis 69B4 = DSM 16987 TaxID=1386082 RepID=A0A0A0BYS9_9CELL|nr:dihydroxyacetone kinase subunit DhaK [Cellulomonas bogoriensis]KGM12842.1 dihydroxyacetone kinase [Cellulomonas bogoriensis 69B4 = DSM 16987]
MKKLMNEADRFVPDVLEGFGAAHADLVQVHGDPWFVTRRDRASGKVGLVSGGGTGHEPLHVGFVGHGMLDAAVPGPVFTSPTPDAIVAASRAADGGRGVVHVVKNYTGDVLNFETAAELLEDEGIAVRTVLVDDDVAVQGSTFTAGRRGVAGVVPVEKIAGAAAERGDGLDEVVAVAERVVGQVRTMGVALAAATVPHVGRPGFDLAEGEVEIGVGIHGEPGRRRGPLEPADALTGHLVEPLLQDLALGGDDEVLLLVNGMGGTPLSELYVVYRGARRHLEDAGVRVARSSVGNLVTSLDMQGASVTTLRLDPELMALWDAPVRTPALRW